jgi:crotonobetainyl-CoA:carnitine CoA-transferase CaiB-like acyl-CoA transferase
MDQTESALTSALPLAGFRILSSEQYGAGPYGTMFLAQLGAEVIKIEPPNGGDSARATGPYFLGDNDSLFFQTFNLNKRSLTLDLRRDEGQAVLRALTRSAHAVTNNARGDIPAKLGLDYAALGEINPAIVCVHASAYGRTGERAAWPGYDYLMQAEAGFMSVTGAPDDPPTRFGLSMVDFMTGSMLATATLSGLIYAARTGLGKDYDISLLDTALHQTSYPAFWYLNAKHMVGRIARSAHPSIAPSQTFRTADGWVFVMAQMPKFWIALVDTLGAGHLKDDPRFSSVAARFEHRDALTVILDSIFMQFPTAHWVEKLGGAVPVAPVNDLAQALASPDAAAMIENLAHPDAPEGLRTLANPVRIDGQRLVNVAAPKLGADSDEILAEIGYDARGIERLREQGIV